MNVDRFKSVLPTRVRRPLGVTRRWLRSLPSRTLRQKMQLLKSNRLTPDEFDLLAKIDSRISYEDGMYAGNGDHYFRVGLSAIQCINQALSQTRIEPIRKILDLPCGYGRVLRFLVHRFSNARITACELMPDAVEFCAKTFGAVPVYAKQNPSELSFADQFDLIWCGSLFTHLDQTGIVALLDLFRRTLLPDGVAVFTTQGERVVERMIAREYDYGIAIEKIPLIVGAYRESGYGFTTYPDVSEYGVAASMNSQFGKHRSQAWLAIQAARW